MSAGCAASFCISGSYRFAARRQKPGCGRCGTSDGHAMAIHKAKRICACEAGKRSSGSLALPRSHQNGPAVLGGAISRSPGRSRLCSTNNCPSEPSGSLWHLSLCGERRATGRGVRTRRARGQVILALACRRIRPSTVAPSLPVCPFDTAALFDLLDRESFPDFPHAGTRASQKFAAIERHSRAAPTQPSPDAALGSPTPTTAPEPRESP